MAALKTKSELREYILRQLGAPLVQVEVSPEQINDIIDNTVQEYSSFALEGELTKYLKLTIDAPCTITLAPESKSIQRITKGGGFSIAGFGTQGLVLDYYSLAGAGINLNDSINNTILMSSQRSMFEKYFGNDVSFLYNENKKKIDITEKYKGAVIIEVNTEYVPDAIDYIFDHNWIKKMCVARTKLLQSDITGKYDANLVGGARINSDRMQQRAEQEIEVLREELLANYGGPAPMVVG